MAIIKLKDAEALLREKLTAEQFNFAEGLVEQEYARWIADDDNWLQLTDHEERVILMTHIDFGIVARSEYWTECFALLS